jgi:hypothetical protein
VLSLGSTLSVEPACSFRPMAAQRGVPYLIVNLGPIDPEDEPCVSLRLEADVSDALPRAIAAPLHCWGCAPEPVVLHQRWQSLSR